MVDAATYIRTEVTSLMHLVDEIDAFYPEEDLVEVLIGAVTAWGTVEAELLYSALEVAFEGTESVMQAARDRLNTLYALQSTIHEGEGADESFNALARKYVDGVKYHLAVDVAEMAPLAAQLPLDISQQLAGSMKAMKLDLE